MSCCKSCKKHKPCKGKKRRNGRKKVAAHKRLAALRKSLFAPMRIAHHQTVYAARGKGPSRVRFSVAAVRALRSKNPWATRSFKYPGAQREYKVWKSKKALDRYVKSQTLVYGPWNVQVRSISAGRYASLKRKNPPLMVPLLFLPHV